MTKKVKVGEPTETVGDRRLMLVEGGQIAMSRQLTGLDTRIARVESTLGRLLVVLQKLIDICTASEPAKAVPATAEHG